MGKDRKDKDKKHTKEKKSKDKKRRRDDSDSGSSSDDEEARRHKAHKLAQKVLAHAQRAPQGADAPFLWGKKVEKEIGEGKKLKDISIFSDRNRQQERLDELEKVRKRQAEREAEKERREEELLMIQRMRAAQDAMDSEAKEQEFYLQSLLAKAERRLREGRPAPSDLIARNLHVGLRLGDTADFNHKEPWKYFEGLQLDDTEALHDDINEYAQYDKYEALHQEFWKALLEVADYELAEARRRDEVDKAHLKGGAEAAAAVAAAAAHSERGLHTDVVQDVLMMLKGQTYAELDKMEAVVARNLETGEGDSEYWQAVMSRLKIFKAKAHVREIQSRIMGATLQRLAQEAAEAAEEMGVASDRGDSEGRSDEDDEEHARAAGPSGGVSGLGAGSAVARAMGWAKEKRGVVRAEGDIANPEEIDLEGIEEAGEAGAEGAEAGAGAEGGAVGPVPAQIVYPQEVPGFGRRYPRKRTNTEGPDPENEPQRVGGDAGDEPEEVVADGSMSPRPLRQGEVKATEEVIGEEDDYKEVELLRQQVRLQTSARFKAARQRIEEAGTSTEDRSVRVIMRDSGMAGCHPMNRNTAATEGEAFRSGMSESLSKDEEMTLAQFKVVSQKAMGGDGSDRDWGGGEIPLESQVYWWHDKYKPRKPKYFNRVHTGYEWSKYNQTHYDYDNPPPKVVQGYKFNILYHDLVDKNQTPTYVIERDPQSSDNSTCIIRFIAGPPYEDIAFKIVNKEWNYARKHGFRCAFERGILHLFVNFQRTRYRR